MLRAMKVSSFVCSRRVLFCRFDLFCGVQEPEQGLEDCAVHCAIRWMISSSILVSLLNFAHYLTRSLAFFLILLFLLGSHFPSIEVCNIVLSLNPRLASSGLHARRQMFLFSFFVRSFAWCCLIIFSVGVAQVRGVQTRR